MDIKLRARLSAYSKIESFEAPADSEHNCKFMTPVTREQIDEFLFKPNTETLPPEQDSGATVPGASFIDALFEGV